MHTDAVLTHEHHHDADVVDVFGFWLYILTDCVLFGSLFATFLVLNEPLATTQSLKKYIDLPYVLIETFFLLTSNFTFCLAILSLYKEKILHVQFWLLITLLFGAGFIGMEVNEFMRLAHEGFSWDFSGQASSFFTLVGTHGLHVTIGLIWITLMIIQLPLLKITQITRRRMIYLGMFWNFLDIVWIFVFTIVYLMGAI